MEGIFIDAFKFWNESIWEIKRKREKIKSIFLGKN